MSDNKTPCPIGIRLLPPYLAGKLTGTPVEEEFKEHVRTCEDCKALVADRRKAMQVLIASAETAVLEGHPNKQTKPNTNRIPPALAFKNLPWKFLSGMSALAILLIALTYVFGPQLSIIPLTAKEDKLPNPSLTRDSLQEEQTTSASAIHSAEEIKNVDKKESETPKQPPAPDNQPKNIQTPPKPLPRTQPAPTRKTTQHHSKIPITNSTKPALGAPKKSQNPPTPQTRVEVTDENGKRIGESIIPYHKESSQ